MQAKDKSLLYHFAVTTHGLSNFSNVWSNPDDYPLSIMFYHELVYNWVHRLLDAALIREEEENPVSSFKISLHLQYLHLRNDAIYGTSEMRLLRHVGIPA